MEKPIFYLVAALVLLYVPLSLGAAQSSPTTTDKSQALTDNEIMSTETIRLTRFKILDSNGDGYLERNEVPKNDSTLRSQFHILDANRDGRLSAKEYAYFSQPG